MAPSLEAIDFEVNNVPEVFLNNARVKEFIVKSAFVRTKWLVKCGIDNFHLENCLKAML